VLNSSAGTGIVERNGYSDTSFLVSLYTPDANSVPARSALIEGRGLLITPFGEFEFANAIELRVFRKEITRSQANASLGKFRSNSSIFVFRPIPQLTFERAMQLSREHTPELGVRGMDVLHVAIALELGAAVFFTFDRGQRRLARAAGLKIRPA
jgi:predicted nucleic acid-binding protein